jgi:hypothetical protein
MAEPQLSVRSAKARDLAHRLARRENRSIADIVERELERVGGEETIPVRKLILVKHAAPQVIPALPACTWHLSAAGQQRCLPLACRLAASRAK